MRRESCGELWGEKTHSYRSTQSSAQAVDRSPVPQGFSRAGLWKGELNLGASREAGVWVLLSHSASTATDPMGQFPPFCPPFEISFGKMFLGSIQPPACAWSCCRGAVVLLSRGSLLHASPVHNNDLAASPSYLFCNRNPWASTSH